MEGSRIRLLLPRRGALVSGGSRGIGAATVRALIHAGARVFFNYLQASAVARSLVTECGPDTCATRQCNLSGSEAARELVDAAIDFLGKLDVLVVNHGIWVADDVSVEQMRDEQWRRTIAINLEAAFGLIKHTVSHMKRQKPPGGSIVVVSSSSGQIGESFHSDYAASKGGLISMVKSLATELAPYNIRVNCVAPGWVKTDLVSGALKDPEVLRNVLRQIPLGRLGTPEEIAAAIVFLCTPYAGFITGEVLNINGGEALVG